MWARFWARPTGAKTAKASPPSSASTPSKGGAADLTGLLGTFIAYVEGASYTVTATPADTTLAPGRVFDFVAPPPAGSILSLPLQRASYLAGTIRDSNGNPVRGASIKFDDEVLLRRMPSTKGTL